MTTTIAFGESGDGWIQTASSTYSLARDGASPIAQTATAYGTWGQDLSGGSYVARQVFLGFAYTVPTNEKITAAYIRVKDSASTANTGISRSLQFMEYNWGGTVETTDWRTAAQVSALSTLATIDNAEDNSSKYMMAGSDALITRLASASPLRLVGMSSRQSAGITPTSGEYANFYISETSGTADDPALVFTSVPQSRLFGVLGAQVQLSDGTHAYLEAQNEAASSILMKHHNGTSASTVATVPIGSSIGQFDPDSTSYAANGAQFFSLVVDASDNLYVIGRYSLTTVAGKAYTKGIGYTWTAQTLINASLPSYTDGTMNNFAAAWHNVGTSGTIMAVVSHAAGRTPNTTGDIVYALLNCQSLLAGSGTLLRNSGAARGVVVSAGAQASYYTSYVNETGTLLDVVAAPGTSDRGYVVTVNAGGQNGDAAQEFPTVYQRLYRYVLSSDGSSLADTDITNVVYGGVPKDASAKMRVVGLDGTTFAVVVADGTSGDGISVTIKQNTGTTSSFNLLGTVELDNNGPTSMPSATTFATSQAWDALYDTTSNKIWVYYLDVANSNRLLRTSIDMNTYLAAADEVQVSAAIGAAGSTNYAIRVHRGKTNGQKVLVSVASKTSGGVHSTIYILDTLNVAPNAPTLTAKANFDATASSIFTWTFSDPNAGDTQSAYQLQIDNASTGASAVDTGKVVSTTSSRTVGASTLSNGVNYQWRVRTYDALDAVGAYSSYGTFSTSASGTVTITTPATDNPAGVITSNYNIVWSVSGTTQAAYRVVVIRSDTSATLVDTGFVTSTATTYNVTGMLTDVQYQISVTVRNASLVVSGAGTRLITPSYANPEKPTFSTSVMSDHILITVNNPTPTGDKPEVTENQILRRVNGTSDAYSLVGTTTVDSEFKDYTAASSVTYQYIVRGAA